MVYLQLPEGVPMFDKYEKDLVCFPMETTNAVGFKLVDDYFPGGSFQMSTETGKCLDFMSFVGEFFNDSETKVIQVDVRLFTSNEYGPIALQQDQGYSHLWVSDFEVLQKLHEWFLKYKLNSNE